MIERSIKPEPQKGIVFEIPEIEKFELSNGLKVFLVKKNSLPIVQFNYMTGSGSKSDPENKKGLAYLTALLIDEGAGNLSALELDNEIESLGSVLKVSCDHDSLSITLLTLKEHINKSFEIFSDIILRPRFEQDDFNREHKKLLNKIIQAGNEPSYVADTVFEKLVFENSNYMHPAMGRKETVENITNQDVINFYKNNFYADNSALIVTGNITKNEIISLTGGGISDLKTGIIDEPKFESLKPGKGKIYFVHKDDAAQSEIRVGHITNGRKHPDYFAKLLMNTILGGQFSSRLNSNLREDKGFTYGINSGFYYNKVSGQFEISTAVQSQNTGAAINEIFSEIKGIHENIFDEEIEFAKSYLIKRFPSQFETYSQVSRQILTLVHYNLPDDYFNTYIGKIEGTSNQDIKNAALNYINMNELKIIVVGDKKIVFDDLKKLNKEVIELDF